MTLVGVVLADDGQLVGAGEHVGIVPRQAALIDDQGVDEGHQFRLAGNPQGDIDAGHGARFYQWPRRIAARRAGVEVEEAGGDERVVGGEVVVGLRHVEEDGAALARPQQRGVERGVGQVVARRPPLAQLLPGDQPYRPMFPAG